MRKSEAHKLNHKPGKKTRYAWFKNNWFPLIRESYDITEVTERYCFQIITKQDTIEYFPKADKLHFHSNNKWIENGIEWINNNL